MKKIFLAFFCLLPANLFASETKASFEQLRSLLCGADSEVSDMQRNFMDSVYRASPGIAVTESGRRVLIFDKAIPSLSAAARPGERVIRKYVGHIAVLTKDEACCAADIVREKIYSAGLKVSGAALVRPDREHYSYVIYYYTQAQEDASLEVRVRYFKNSPELLIKLQENGVPFFAEGAGFFYVGAQVLPAKGKSGPMPD